MICFDRYTRHLLWLIYITGRHGFTWKHLKWKRSHHDELDDILRDLTIEGYITSKDDHGHAVPTDNMNDLMFGELYVSKCTPKGREYLQRTSLDGWRWFVPTMISLLALAASVASLWLQLFQQMH